MRAAKTEKRGGLPVGQLLRDYLSEQFRVLCECEAVARAGLDTEGVHQMRVAARRIQAVLSTACGQPPPGPVSDLDCEFAWLARALGKVRDLDVLIGGLGRAAAPAIDRFGGYLENQRAARRGDLFERLAGERYAGLKSAFAQFLDGTVATLGTRSVGATLQQVLASEPVRIRWRMRRADARGRRGDEDLHRLRIQLKRLRYALEWAVPVYGERLTRLLHRLSRTQGRLGEFHDVCVALQRLDTYSERRRKTGKKLAHRRARLQKRAKRLRASIREEDLPRLRKLLRKKPLRKVFGDFV